MAPSIVKAPAGKTRAMSDDDPGERIERSTHELEEDLDRLEGHLDDAKGHLEERRREAQGPGEEAEEVAGDWHDEAPRRPMGDDAVEE
jgi:hypothetical protein